VIHGVDVSRHQPPTSCDWIAAAAAGLRFAFVKLTEGQDYLDPAAAGHLASIRRTRILAGAYHFGRPDNRILDTDDGRDAGAREGEWFARNAIAVGAVRGCLPPVLDLEKYAKRDNKPTSWNRDWRADYVRGLIDTVEALCGVTAIVYAGPTYWGYQHSTDLAVELRDRGCLLWLVKYGDGLDPSATIDGWPWSIWQWSGGGDSCFADPWPGLPHPIDRNVYRGSERELAALMGQ